MNTPSTLERSLWGVFFGIVTYWNILLYFEIAEWQVWEVFGL